MTTPRPAAGARLPRMLTVADMAERLHVSTKTVRRWIERGELHVHRIGRQLRISEEDAATFIGKGRR